MIIDGNYIKLVNGKVTESLDGKNLAAVAGTYGYVLNGTSPNNAANASITSVPLYLEVVNNNTNRPHNATNEAEFLLLDSAATATFTVANNASAPFKCPTAVSLAKKKPGVAYTANLYAQVLITISGYGGTAQGGPNNPQNNFVDANGAVEFEFCLWNVTTNSMVLGTYTTGLTSQMPYTHISPAVVTIPADLLLAENDIYVVRAKKKQSAVQANNSTSNAAISNVGVIIHMQ